MVISASRRTDIPAFFSDWLLERLKAGFCSVANPFNPRQVRQVSLLPCDVDAIVFWSKNPAPLLLRLGEVDALGLRYYFLYTINDYPLEIEPAVPPLATRIATFRKLAARLGPARVVWRYDPVIFSAKMSSGWHLDRFTRIAESLTGCCDTVIISVMDWYAKTRRKIEAMERAGVDQFERDTFNKSELMEALAGMARCARDHGMTVQACSEDGRLNSCGIPAGKCIDDARLLRVFGAPVPPVKDPGQRPGCLCCVSRDIGAPGTCRHGCVYCYAARI